MRDNFGHFIILSGNVHKEDIILINIYAPNQEAPKYTQQLLTELNGETKEAQL